MKLLGRLGTVVLIATFSWAVGFLLMVVDTVRVTRSIRACAAFAVAMGPITFVIVMVALPLFYAPLLFAVRRWVAPRRPRLVLPLVAAVLGTAMFTHFVTRGLSHPLDVSYLAGSFWPQYVVVIVISVSFGLGYAKYVGT
ncbi:MAG: hypothetical protein ACE5JR_11640 [Gemmatimonadota bacterium]